LLPKWDLSPGVSIANQTDTTISLKFNGFGKFKISSTLLGCIPVKDSLFISIAPKTTMLDLGDDIGLCENSVVTLKAGPSFMAYQWSDGSRDSVLRVSQPGMFWVQVTDSCGNSLRDSVKITTSKPTINVGPDRTKCNNDTLRLTAPSGFTNYSWSNNYNISSTKTQNVVVNPLVDTAYYVKAEKTPGCFAYDTVRIKVHQSPPISLGTDKSFCAEDSTVFNAGAGFTKYTWSTGAKTQKVIVKAAGSYSVSGTTAEGCKSLDTVQVVAVHPLPVVMLDKNPALCTGSEKLLDAGNFASYNWSNGSTSKTIKINGVGVYSVTVADTNGCKGSDTTIISTLHPLPGAFLPADTVICSYGTLEMKPLTSFNRYLWSNGSVGSSITITQPGHYWLEATDGNLCKGRDSILVAPKQCMQGFYIANAFTPNGDYKNDIMRPLLFGNVKSYRFTIYNRWGEIVFQTNELRKGWDGKFAGRLQQTGVFIWICNYQFEGAEDKTQKGTFTLIR
jgi:gliding motility-associated-like protein